MNRSVPRPRNHRAAIALLLLAASRLVCAAPDAFEYTRIVTGDDGLTHFAAGTETLAQTDYAPPTPAIAVSRRIAATDIAFAVIPAGWYGDWHPAPRRQFALVLEGAFEIETGDGERRRFGHGAVFLLEDVSGQGHRTRVVSEQAVKVALVPVPQ